MAFGTGGTAGQEKRLRKACADLRGYIVLRCEDKDGKRTAGHWIQQERPAEVNGHLVAFLKDTLATFKSAPGVPLPRGTARSRL